MIVCWRKSKVSEEKISVFNVIEKLMEHTILCLPCSFTNGAIDMLLQQLRRHTDFKVTTWGCHSVKVLSTTVDYSLVAVVTNLFHHLTYDAAVAWHTVYAMLLSNYN